MVVLRVREVVDREVQRQPPRELQGRGRVQDEGILDAVVASSE
jgi:hypothetical protein